jgi:NAD(P) transhydrogenase subunit alpha
MMWPPPAPPTPKEVAPPEPGVPTKSSAAKSAAVAAAGGSSGHGSADIGGINPVVLAVVGLILLGLGFIAPDKALSHFTVFLLACFVGYQVVWNVKPALHTPLMSVTNAISGIILVGGMLQLTGSVFKGNDWSLGSLNLTVILGAIAVLIAAINIAGGFLVTNRMLGMFRK